MPELPEVEVVVRSLRKHLVNSSVVDGEVIYPHFASQLSSLPTGKILDVSRHGKWIIIAFEQKQILAINLGMSGRFSLDKLNVVPKHTRWRMLLSSGNREFVVNYIDPRCMGRIKAFSGKVYNEFTSLSSHSKGNVWLNLGPDWLSPILVKSSLFDRATLIERALASSLAPIKTTLLDQSRIAGAGNIYANEFCHVMRIHPSKLSCDITFEKYKLLASKAIDILQASIAAGGTSFHDANSYLNVEGKEGNYLDKLLVYSRDKMPCKTCNTKIKKYKLHSRATYYCPKCQEI